MSYYENLQSKYKKALDILHLRIVLKDEILSYLRNHLEVPVQLVKREQYLKISFETAEKELEKIKQTEPA